jgi:tRNA uridine 5-carboxymethylaminomethyl modification enzyme
LKYEGYISRQNSQIAQFKKLEGWRIPDDFEYRDISGLRRESREKLAATRPVSVGQASRISGVSPADISALMVILRGRSAAGAQAADAVTGPTGGE